MTYLDVDGVEAEVVALAAAYPTTSRLVDLPHPSFEGRACHAIRLGGGTDGSRRAILIIGGVHAREWGSCEIALSFAADLLEAHETNAGLAYGGKSFTAQQIQDLLNSFHIFVFPLVNPDGRRHSQVQDALWRANRNTVYAAAANCYPPGRWIGVDINRNYDFLFNYRQAFSLDSDVFWTTSDEPCNNWGIYQGPSPFSENETKNVKWLLDGNPRVRWFIDLHSYGRMMLYSWGDDENQRSHRRMNFLNPDFDGLRGVPDDSAYREYHPGRDRQQDFANHFRDAVQAVRGHTYAVAPSFYLYPTAGTSDDYVYARQWLSDSRSVDGFTVEWGTEFQPPWAEMENVIIDVSAGLVEFALHARWTTQLTLLPFRSVVAALRLILEIPRYFFRRVFGGPPKGPH